MFIAMTCGVVCDYYFELQIIKPFPRFTLIYVHGFIRKYSYSAYVENCEKPNFDPLSCTFLYVGTIRPLYVFRMTGV